MTKTTYFTATSLDGYIADEHNSLAWLFRQKQGTDDVFDYNAFIANVGAIVMGSTTYEWITAELSGEVPGPDGTSVQGWPYEMPTWVMTTRNLEKLDGDIRFARGDVPDVYAAMAAVAGDKDIWVVGGGDLAGQFADAGLLDEVVVSIASVTLGAGAPLLPRTLDVRLEAAEPSGDFIVARYSVPSPSVA